MNSLLASKQAVQTTENHYQDGKVSNNSSSTEQDKACSKNDSNHA